MSATALFFQRREILRYTHLIWDFNGTVLDDVEVGIDSANALLVADGLKEIPSVEAYRSLFGFPIKSYYERLGVDFSKTSFEELAPVWVEEYLSRVKNAKLNDGVLQTIQKVKSLGICQILLSATQQDMLKRQIYSLGIESCFDAVLGLDNIHAVSKEKLAQDWCEQNPSATPLFLGDTDHDFAVASATGNSCVLFSGGHQSKERLSRLGCPVIDRIPDVMPYLL